MTEPYRLFLDIDGVLNSRDSLSRELLIGNPRNKRYDIHREYVERLNVLMKKLPESTEITISSSWRRAYFEELPGILADRGFEFADRITSRTPVDMQPKHMMGRIPRWEEIWAFINEKNETGMKVLVLDDERDADDPYGVYQFHHVNNDYGLTWTDVIGIIERAPKTWELRR